MSETVLTLARHGEPEWNAAGRIQGHLDIPLSATGLAQAAAIGRRLGEEAAIRQPHAWGDVSHLPQELAMDDT